MINGRPFSGTGYGFNPSTGRVDLDGQSTKAAYEINLAARAYSSNGIQNVTGLEGGLNEDYDAPDYQNPHLAMIPPRDAQEFKTANGKYRAIPSFHRPGIIRKLGATDATTLRRVMIRPVPEDHNLGQAGGGYFDFSGKVVMADGSSEDGSSIQWDVDCDNDGYRESVWIDLGFPVMTARDGRRYKPLFAILCTDLDGRANVNAHGLELHAQGNFEGNTTGHFASAAGNTTSAMLPRGLGSGPAHVNLAKIPSLDVTEILNKRYGDNQPGTSGTIEELARIKRFAWPQNVNLPGGYNAQNTRWTSPPDLKERLALGITTAGFAFYDNLSQSDELTNSPYQMNLSRFARRGEPIGTTTSNQPDEAFTPAELEALLRRYDKDAPKLPQRLVEIAQSLSEARWLLTTDSYDPPSPAMSAPAGIRDALNGKRASSILDIVEQRVSGNKNDWIRDNLPWEIVAGLRMDLNRPFGNGQPGPNGIVDEPAGTLTNNSANLGTYGSATLNYANGLTANEDLNGDGASGDNADKQILPRVAFARQLYCLAMLLKDPNFIVDVDDSVDNNEETARFFAQWAINVVDFRDRDSIMTRFAYDPNPLDGWSADGSRVVWGVEKPELLLTETAAVHDRCVQKVDPMTGSAYDDQGMDVDPQDTEPRQVRRPRGTLIVELFHPRNPFDQRPVELYGGAGSQGLQLHRLDATGQSAIWRLAISTFAPVSQTPPNNLPTELAGPQALPRYPITLDPDLGHIERVAYFSNQAATALRDEFSSGNTNNVVRHTAAQQPQPLQPNGYAVVAPAQADNGANATLYLGYRTPTDEEKTDMWMPDDKDKKDVPGELELQNAAGNMAVQLKFNGAAESPPSPIKDPVAVLIKAQGSDKKTRFSVSEPKDGYDKKNTGNDGNGDEFFDFYDRETVKMTQPIDTGVLADDNHEANYRYVYLQRLADPTRPWNKTANPYVIVDVAPVDLATYNSEEQDSDAENKFASRRRGGPDRDVWRWQWQQIGTGSPDDMPLKDSSLGFLNHEQVELGPILTGGAMESGYDFKGDPQEAFPWLPFNDRPYINPYEVLLVPGWDCKNVLREHNVPTISSLTEGLFNHTALGLRQSVRYPNIQGLSLTTLATLLEYLQVPSPFVGTETVLNPQNNPFGDPNIGPADPRFQYSAPFNSVSEYRDPGRVNLNTVYSRDVFNCLVHGLPPLQAAGLWSKFVHSRRGSATPDDPNLPGEFAGAFRTPAGADQVPETDLARNPIVTGLLRTDPTNANSFLFAHESAASQYDNGVRNPYFRLQPIQRLANTTTCRSNVYAVWITVGLFEVSSVDASNNALSVGEAYRDGYRLVRELGSDTGEVVRHRAFYIIDRTIPVAFQRGRTNNAHNCVLISRMIE